MKKKYLGLVILLSFLISGCNNNTPSETNKDDYDSSWEPGENALKDAEKVSKKNPEGNFDSPINKLRITQNNNALPSKGEANILVVPIAFKDDETYVYSDTDLESLRKAYFNKDLNNLTSYPSVREYYALSSDNLLDLTGVVTPIITLPMNYFTYVYRAYNLGDYLSVKCEILTYVYDYLFNETETYYLKDFDSDNDNKIDNIVLTYAYPSLESDTGYSSSYEYMTSFFNSDTYLYTDINSYLDDDTYINSFTFTSKMYLNSLYVNEDLSSYTEGSNDSHEYIKLVAKAIGLPSYLDNTGNSSGTYRSPLGNTDMLEIGIGEMNPFSLYLLGYKDFTKIVSTNINNETILNLDNENNTILITNNDKGIFSEYLLVTLYNSESTINKFDNTAPYYLGYMGINTPGIRVYKIDARLVKKVNNSYYLYTDINNFLNDENDTNYYDFAFTNNYINNYYNYGITYEFPLIELLKKDETNRHMLDLNNPYSSLDQFGEGDIFGDINSISKYYYNFSFDGSGLKKDKLNLSFEVTSLTNEKASIKLWRND